MSEAKKLIKINALIGLLSGLGHGIVALAVNYENFDVVYLFTGLVIAHLSFSIGLALYTFIFFPVVRKMSEKGMVDIS